MTNKIEIAMGKRLRALREEYGLNQTAGSLKLGISQQLVSEYERGVKRASLSRIQNMADAYEVRAAWLAFGTGERDAKIC